MLAEIENKLKQKQVKTKSIPLSKILDGKVYSKIMKRKFMTGESFELEWIIATKEMIKEVCDGIEKNINPKIASFIPYFNLDDNKVA